jgi:hypothetical protein
MATMIHSRHSVGELDGEDRHYDRVYTCILFSASVSSFLFMRACGGATAMIARLAYEAIRKQPYMSDTTTLR